MTAEICRVTVNDTARLEETYFEMMNTPFSRDIQVDRLYVSQQIKEALGKQKYAADRQLFAVVTADPW